MNDLPIVGHEYPWQEILAIAHKLDINDVVHILEMQPPPAKPFKSDGCSGGCPEKWAGKTITSYCIIHDIRYWCGIVGDEVARLRADVQLMMAIALATGDCDFARMVFSGVSVGGNMPGAAWRWGFGR
jgi:hypothetical protein